ncbi:hypothetical protein MRB53_042070 [Persea americana]|nr:hypothetical protein MRB53_042070 [Persea americana]
MHTARQATTSSRILCIRGGIESSEDSALSAVFSETAVLRHGPIKIRSFFGSVALMSCGALAHLLFAELRHDAGMDGQGAGGGHEVKRFAGIHVQCGSRQSRVASLVQ